MSDSPGLVDFAIRLLNSVFNLPDGEVMLLFFFSKAFFYFFIILKRSLVSSHIVDLKTVSYFSENRCFKARS